MIKIGKLIIKVTNIKQTHNNQMNLNNFKIKNQLHFLKHHKILKIRKRIQ